MEQEKEVEELEEKDDFEEIKEMQKTQELKKITEEKVVAEKEEKKSSSLLVTLLVFALFIVFFFGGFAVGGSNIIGQIRKSKLVENSKPNESITEEKLSSAKDFDLSEAKKLLDEFGFNTDIGCHERIYDKYYSDFYKSIVVINKVKDKAKEMACTDFYSDSDIFKDNMNTSNIPIYEGKNGVCVQNKTMATSYDDVNEVYKRMYGKDMPKEGFNGSKISGLYYELYDYNESKNMFVKLSCMGCGGTCGPSIEVNEIKSAKEVDNKVYIDVYYYHDFARSDGNGKTYFALENRFGYHNLDNITTEEDVEKEIRNKYMDQLEIYEVEFEKVDDHYQFVRVVEKVS